MKKRKIINLIVIILFLFLTSCTSLQTINVTDEMKMGSLPVKIELNNEYLKNADTIVISDSLVDLNDKTVMM